MKHLETFLLSILAIFAPIKAVIITAIVLVIADLITGVLAAKKRGEAITSSGFKTTVGKILLYEVAICLAFLVQQYLTGDLFPASKLVAALIGLTELKSILENLDTISGNGMFRLLLQKVIQSKDDLGKK